MYCSWSGTLVFSPSNLADRFSFMLPETGLASIRLSVEGNFTQWLCTRTEVRSMIPTPKNYSTSHPYHEVTQLASTHTMR